MHKLKYIENNGICTVNCPFIEDRMIMSYNCEMCRDFKGDNAKKQYILCSNKGEIKEPEVIRHLYKKQFMNHKSPGKYEKPN